MPRGKGLSELEKSQILEYEEMHMNVRKITGKMKRSRDAVSRFLKRKRYPVLKERRGRRGLLSKLDKCQILRLFSSPARSVADIKAELGLTVSKRTIQRAKKEISCIVENAKRLAARLHDVHGYEVSRRHIFPISCIKSTLANTKNNLKHLSNFSVI